MALLLLQALRLEKRLGVQALPPCAIETGEKTAVSGELSCFEEARHHGHVLGRLLDALGDRPHAVSQLTPGTPDPAHHFPDLARHISEHHPPHHYPPTTTVIRATPPPPL